MTTPPLDPVGPETNPPVDQPATVPTFQPASPEPVLGSAPARPAQNGSKPSGSSRLLTVLLGVAVVVAIGGIAFAAGRATAPASATGGATGRFGNGFRPGGSFDPNAVPGDGLPGANAGRGVRGFGGSVTITGTVDAVSAQSITLKTPSGQSITLGLDAATTYHQLAGATASDVSAGETVEVQMAGGFRPGQAGQPGQSGQPGTLGTSALGTASSVTVVP